VAITLQQLAEHLSAQLVGDGSIVISDAKPLDKATEGEIAFIADEARARDLHTRKASAFLLDKKLSESSFLKDAPQALLIAEDAKLTFLKVLELFHPKRKRANVGISSHATVHPTVKVGLHTNIYPGAHIAEDVIIGEHVDIHPGVCIGPGCRIGDHSVLHPYVVLYHDIHIGKRVIIHAGTVLGTNGFGYQFMNGEHQSLHHYGTVRIEDDVELGANTTIDRALIGATVIGEGSKIDNQCQVAHNCEMGKHNLLAGHAAWAGSVTSEDYVICAGQVGIADHVHIGKGAIIAAQAGVSRNLEGGQTYFGYPAMEIGEMRKQIAALRKLPELREQVREMAAQIKSLQAQIQSLSSSQTPPGGDSAKAA
jgi:UDP-3-O-[3-hydroxymyristoyl] glucosamine N-acyltransferase